MWGKKYRPIRLRPQIVSRELATRTERFPHSRVTEDTERSFIQELPKREWLSDFAVCSVSLSMVPREIAFHSQHLEKSALDSRWLTVWQKSEPILPECSTKANWHTSGKFDSIAERQSRKRKPVKRLHQSLFWVHMQPINNLQLDSQTMSSSLLWQFSS